MKIYLLLLFTLLSLTCTAQNETEYLKKRQVKKDLAFLDKLLQKKSSYQGLNGYEYQADFQELLLKIETEPITEFEFGLFLSKTIGKIGDRHSYVKGFNPRDELYFPLAFAPMQNQIAVLDYDGETKEHTFWNPDYPYLKSIQQIPIEQILPQILPGEALAPKKTYLTRAVRDLRDVETIFRYMGVDLPNPVPITLTNAKGEETTAQVELVDKRNRARLWDERFYRRTFRIKEEQYNDKEFIDRFFKLEDNIASIQIPDMVDREDAPVFFEVLNQFMTKAKQSDALIIDVRDNGGGTRDLIQELAGYLIHPDSVYVVNATRQRGKLPLNKELKASLHSRYLYARNELGPREQAAVDQFMTSFTPMYELDQDRFSEFHYYILNGQKLTAGKYHYTRPVYILANERSFSAASVLVSVFKGLPNLKIAGVTTDGSSGNSERFELPKSGFRGKISTMVSYQKNGQILDGIGTQPDIVIERNLDQIFFKEDYQLNKLKETIREQ